jgi:Tfp pilus assembly protein PilV
MRQERGPGRGQDGFAAVDALVAVTILSSSLALSLMAAQVGGRASHSADETRDAQLLLRERLETTAGRAGAWSGHVRGLDWRVEAHLTETAQARRAAPCARTASAKAASGRTYRIATVDICLPEAIG